MQPVSVPCPSCNAGTIVIETSVLLSGAGFGCPNCRASLSLGASSRDAFQNAFNSVQRMTAQAQRNREAAKRVST